MAVARCSSTVVWTGNDDLRAFGELWLTSALCILGQPVSARRRLTPLAVLVAGCWVVGFAHWTARL